MAVLALKIMDRIASSVLVTWDTWFQSTTQFFAFLLDQIHLEPKHYATLFPPLVSLDQIYELLHQGRFPVLSQLAPALTYAIILSLIRFILQTFLMKPLAEWSCQVKRVPFVSIGLVDSKLPYKLKRVYLKSEVETFCRESGRQVPDVISYLSARKINITNTKKIVKYVEAFWRFIFYTTFSILGYRVLFTPTTAEWVQDTTNHWQGWPYHVMPAAALFYYHIELGCYIHQLVWTEVNHSDFWEMFAHHLITIALLVTSFITNYWRVGVSILWLHDLSDVVLEGCKVLNYTSKPPGRQWLKDYIVDPLFGVFTITFFVTRLVLYPRYILYSVIIEGYRVFGCEWGGCYVFIGLLVALQCLHIFWFSLIVKMLYILMTTGFEGDIRSDDEDEDEPEGEDKKKIADGKDKKKTK